MNEVAAGLRHLRNQLSKQPGTEARTVEMLDNAATLVDRYSELLPESLAGRLDAVLSREGSTTSLVKGPQGYYIQEFVVPVGEKPKGDGGVSPRWTPLTGIQLTMEKALDEAREQINANTKTVSVA